MEKPFPTARSVQLGKRQIGIDNLKHKSYIYRGKYWMVSRRLDFLSSLVIVYIIPLNGIEEACNGNESVCAHD